MHFHADHPLFFAAPRSLRASTASLGLTLGVLVVNAGASSAAVSGLLALVGAALLGAALREGRGRLEPALAWLVGVVALVAVAGAALAGAGRTDVWEGLASVGARVLCGVTWVLWLGTQLDWGTLRQLLLRVRVPEGLVGTLDQALLHGRLTRDEWRRRSDAARTRLGRARLPLATWSGLLGEGALSAFDRLATVEHHALLRSAEPGTAAEPGAAAAAPAEGAPSAFALYGLSVERGGQVALRDVSVSLGPGEWLAVCGPSGAGKSTLLRLLAGLDAPTRGGAQRLGAAIAPGTPLAHRLDGRVALLTQNPEHHFVASTVAEDIAWGLRRRGVDAETALVRAGAVAEALGIAALLGRPCFALSFGEQRRVALAGLLVLEPALLLLDEPTAGLDLVAAHALATLTREVAARTGAACVWATHDLTSLPREVTRVLLLRDGAPVFDGPVAEGLTPAWLRRAGLALPEHVQHETDNLEREA